MISTASTSTDFPPAEQQLPAGLRHAATRTVTQAGSVAYSLFGARADNAFGILVYHRIAERRTAAGNPTMNVSPARFREQIVGLRKRGYVFWTLEKVLRFQERGWPVMPWVTVLTFDDGFASLYRHAWPVLRECNVPATVFLSTAYLDSPDPFPFDHWAIRNRERLAPESYRPLSLDQCRELHSSGLVHFGAHTHTHQDFRNRPGPWAQDIQTNLDHLAYLFDAQDVPFAFPYGAPHSGFTSGPLTEIVRRSGVRCGLTTAPRLVRTGEDPFHWGRLHVNSWDTSRTLAGRLGGWSNWTARWHSPLSKPSVVSGETARLVATGSRSCKPLISVILSTSDRPDWLQDALGALSRQITNDEFEVEIVVLGNDSAGRISDVVELLANRLPQCCDIHVAEQRGSESASRNRAIDAARGEWLALLSDNRLPDPHWLQELYRTAVHSGASIVGGSVHLQLTDSQLDGLGPVCRNALQEFRLYDRVQSYRRCHFPVAGNTLVARRVFERVGKFDETMASGDSEREFFARARDANWNLVYSPSAVIQQRVADERLRPESFRSASLLRGADRARHLSQRHGRIGLLVTCLTQIVVACLIDWPLLWTAALADDSSHSLDYKTRLWRTEGFARTMLAMLAPRFFPQQEFFDAIQTCQGRRSEPPSVVRPRTT